MTTLYPRHADRQRVTAATSATLLVIGMPPRDTQSYSSQSETQPAPAAHDSKPLSAADPSVQTCIVSGLAGTPAKGLARRLLSYLKTLVLLWPLEVRKASVLWASRETGMVKIRMQPKGLSILGHMLADTLWVLATTLGDQLVCMSFRRTALRLVRHLGHVVSLSRVSTRSFTRGEVWSPRHPPPYLEDCSGMAGW